MPRVRAADYDAKLLGIVDAAAALFAESGYSGARMSQIADACGVSKSMLYHYFATKDDLLFFMVKEHLEDLTASLEDVMALDYASERDALYAFVSEFVVSSVQARQRNIVLMNDARYLSPEKHVIAEEMQRKVVDLFRRQLKRIRPTLDDNALTVHAFFLIGLINWTDSWFDPSGRISQPQLAEMLTQQFLCGFNAVGKTDY